GDDITADEDRSGFALHEHAVGAAGDAVLPATTLAAPAAARRRLAVLVHELARVAAAAARTQHLGAVGVGVLDLEVLVAVVAVLAGVRWRGLEQLNGDRATAVHSQRALRDV